MTPDTQTIPQPVAALDPQALAALLDHLPCGVVLVGPDLALLYRNASAARWTQAGNFGAAMADARVLEDEFAGWEVELRRVLATGKARHLACSVRRGDADEPHTLTLHCAPYRLRKGRAYDTVMVVLDDGAAWAALEQRLVVAERLAAVGKLAARVAHELNNPLDGILRYVNLALRLVGDSPQDKLKNYLDVSRTGLMRMVQIVGDLLAFSRTTQGEFDLVGIDAVVEQAVAAAAAQVDANRVIMAVDLQTRELPSVRGGRLYQVCSNLIRNAIDAMPNGGRLTVTAGLVGGDVVIRVADTGVGLPNPPEKVFEPFYTTKPPGKGTGLGLSICREFVEDMGGRISAETGAEGGAVFTVRLPRASCHTVAEGSREQGTGSGEQGTGSGEQGTRS